MKAIEDKKTWWRESRFGMFVHWGLYSVMAKGEWVMYNSRIPVREYEKLAGQFHPKQFDPEAWVKLAQAAGMKYIVFTTKHHDGFSMFQTNVTDYNSVKATPFGRDAVAELASACEKHDIRLGLYYSHVREWHHPQAQSMEMINPETYGNFGNFWDYPDETLKNLQVYIDEFDIPQLKELLTHYGPLGMIWFDTASLIRPDQAQELLDCVRSLQPNCLVNSRIGDHVDFDYYSLGDDQVPDFNNGVDFETPMTICDFWGYNTMPGNRYRDAKEMIHQLIDIVSLGGNYLLNVGPDGDGVIPAEAQERLEEIGAWMRVHGEAIYATEASPFPAKPSWGRITRKADVLYLHVYQWRESLVLTGIQSQAVSVTCLDEPDMPIRWAQQSCGNLGYDTLTIHLPTNAPDAVVSVLKVQLDDLRVESRIIEADDGSLQLPACLATLHSIQGQPQATVNIAGVVQNWLSVDDSLRWECICQHPGTFAATVTMSSDYHGNWDFGHEVVLACNGQEVRAQLEDTGAPTGHYQRRTFKADSLRLDAPGQYTLTLRATHIQTTHRQGITLSMVRLNPVPA